MPSKTISLVELRASPINGCSVCVDMHSRNLKKAGETDDRVFAVAAWRHVPYFTDAERAALALAEAITRLSDRTDPVPDEIWEETGRHYDEKAPAALIVAIAKINVWPPGQPDEGAPSRPSRRIERAPAGRHLKSAGGCLQYTLSSPPESNRPAQGGDHLIDVKPILSADISQR